MEEEFLYTHCVKPTGYTVGYFGDLRWSRRRGMLLLVAALPGLPCMRDLQRPAHRQPKDVCTCLWMHIGCWEGVSINFIWKLPLQSDIICSHCISRLTSSFVSLYHIFFSIFPPKEVKRNCIYKDDERLEDSVYRWSGFHFTVHFKIYLKWICINCYQETFNFHQKKNLLVKDTYNILASITTINYLFLCI